MRQSAGACRVSLPAASNVGREPNTHECSALPTTPRLIRHVLLAILAAAVLLPAPVAAGDHVASGTHKMLAAEAKLLRDINRIRARNGRRPLRLDKSTSAVARARSRDMAAKRYFAHTEPDGDDARRILRRRDIPASEVTENIGHTVGLSLREGTNRMATWWYHSPPHRRQMLARDINYVGIGIARRGGRHTYTVIHIRSRDKSDPRVIIDKARWQLHGRGSRVIIDWHGVDPKLATGKSGIKRFHVQRRTAGGDWTRVVADPQRSKVSFSTRATGEQRIRIRAIDKAGNVGPWKYVSIDLPEARPRRIRV